MSLTPVVVVRRPRLQVKRDTDERTQCVELVEHCVERERFIRHEVAQVFVDALCNGVDRVMYLSGRSHGVPFCRV